MVRLAAKLEVRAVARAEVTRKAEMEIKHEAEAMRKVSARSVQCWCRERQAMGAWRVAAMMPRLEVSFLVMAC